MKSIQFVLLVVLMGWAFGCGSTPTDTNEAERAAESMLTALKNSEVDGFFEGIDFQGLYDALPEEDRKQTSYDDWKKFTCGMIAMAVGSGDMKQLEFDVLGSEATDDGVTVQVKARKNPEEPWVEKSLLFKQIDGKWKTSSDLFT